MVSFSLSKLTVFILSILLLIGGTLFYPKWKIKNEEAQISWDAGGYYWYLPSMFIYEDITGQNFKDSIINEYQPVPKGYFGYALQVENGNYVMKYTLGMALVESPFFFAAHAYALSSDKYHADGFSPPYQVAIYLGGLLIGLIGLIFLRKVLLKYYSEITTTISLIVLVLGTNYYNYVSIEVGMTHTWLFTLNTLILYCSILFYESYKKKYIYLVALFLGLATLIRPTEIVSVLIPLLWALPNIKWSSIKERLNLFYNNIQPIIFSASIFLLIVSLQFIYWKYASGDWFVYSYEDQGFNWFKPLFNLYAFNYQTGWLRYTPTMVLLLLAIPFYCWKGYHKWAVLSYTLITYYVVASWSLWDIGGRAMIQSYPILIFILAFFIQEVFKSKYLKYPLMAFLLYGMTFNIWWTYHAHYGPIFSSVPSNKTYYMKTLLKNKVPERYQFLRDHPEIYEKEVKDSTLLVQQIYEEAPKIEGSNTFEDQFIITSLPDAQWIRVFVDVEIEVKEWNPWYMTLLNVQLHKNKQEIKGGTIRLQRLINDYERKTLYFDIKLDQGDFEEIIVKLYNDQEGEKPLYVHSIEVYALK